jgi:hypothetical protein
MEYRLGQSFNSGKVRNSQSLETDSATMQVIVDLTPKGQTVFNPTATGAQGTARVMPTVYREGLIVGYDKTDKKFNSTFVSIKYGKATLSDDDILLACDGKLEVPNGTSADSLSIKKLRTVGA